MNKISRIPNFGEIDQDEVKVDFENLKKCGIDYAHKWIEELKEEKQKWANAYYNLLREIENKN